MASGRVRGLVRGSAAWVFGYGLTLVLVVVGLVDRSGGAFRGAADAYIAAHGFFGSGRAPLFLVAVPILVLGVAGYRAGRTLRSGLSGRLRAFVQSLLRANQYRIWQAATAAVLLAAGYTLAAVFVALFVETGLADAVVGSLLAGLVIGIPSAIVGAFR